VGALRIAARFFDRSAATKTFKRGMDAHNNPGFYRQLGRDPDLLLSAALTELLARKFQLVTAFLSSILPRIVSYRISPADGSGANHIRSPTGKSCTGTSMDFSPLRIRSMYEAAYRPEIGEINSAMRGDSWCSFRSIGLSGRVNLRLLAP
jgi:hypothetical protein